MDINIFRPSVGGWLERKLSDVEMNHLWECVADQSPISMKPYLAAQNYDSRLLEDKNDLFFKNVLGPLCDVFGSELGNMGDRIIETWKPYKLNEMWVNYQKEGEFIPNHQHPGIYSFVVWMKIPYNHKEQNKDNKSSAKFISTFQMCYSTVTGQTRCSNYNLGPEYEGTMLLFPSQMMHQVYPFYNCKETRISISGNISFDF
tara:strand:- start:459 stop:1064 length:606 start_codon:yes stop_codon:yes gene_type:complete